MGVAASIYRFSFHLEAPRIKNTTSFHNITFLISMEYNIFSLQEFDMCTSISHEFL